MLINKEGQHTKDEIHRIQDFLIDIDILKLQLPFLGINQKRTAFHNIKVQHFTKN